MSKPNQNDVRVYGQPGGDLFILSKFASEGVFRSFDDFEWTLKTFQYENPRVGTIGLSTKSYYKRHSQIKFFEKQNLMKLMIKLLQKTSKNMSKQSLINLKMSITSGNENNRDLEEKVKQLEKTELGESMDVSINEEPRDSAKRR